MSNLARKFDCVNRRGMIRYKRTKDIYKNTKEVHKYKRKRIKVQKKKTEVQKKKALTFFVKAFCTSTENYSTWPASN